MTKEVKRARFKKRARLVDTRRLIVTFYCSLFLKSIGPSARIQRKKPTAPWPQSQSAQHSDKFKYGLRDEGRWRRKDSW